MFERQGNQWLMGALAQLPLEMKEANLERVHGEALHILAGNLSKFGGLAPDRKDLALFFVSGLPCAGEKPQRVPLCANRDETLPPSTLRPWVASEVSAWSAGWHSCERAVRPIAKLEKAADPRPQCCTLIPQAEVAQPESLHSQLDDLPFWHSAPRPAFEKPHVFLLRSLRPASS